MHADWDIPRMCRDGHISLLRWLVEHDAIDSAEAVVANWGETPPRTETECNGRLVLRQLATIDEIEPADGDIVWVRGSHRPWIPWIEKQTARKLWMIYYDGNTGRSNWPYWSIIVSDIIEKSYIAPPSRRHPMTWNWLGRLYYYYAKPVSPVFSFNPSARQQYDLCLNASYIYDRKCQYLTYRAVLEYERRYGKVLRVVVPGCFRSHEEETEKMRMELPAHTNFVLPGFLDQRELCAVHNASLLYSASTGGGYGDRAPVEAGVCGCPILISYPSPKYHASYTRDPAVARILTTPKDPVQTAAELHEALAWARTLPRASIADHFRRHVSVETGSGPQLKRLLDVLRAHPKADNEVLKELVTP
jgi:hypothetical protein